MSVLFVLIVASLLVAGGFLIAFLWAARTGQFDDSHTPATRILFDNNPATDDEKSRYGNSEEPFKENKTKPDV